MSWKLIKALKIIEDAEQPDFNIMA